MPIIETERLRLACASAIKAYRIKNNLTQQNVSDLSELSRSYISELEDGKHLPTVETIFRLAHCFDIQPLTMIRQIYNRYLK